MEKAFSETSPSRTPVLVLRLLLYAALGLLIGPTDADADLWGHVRFGADILASGRIPSADPYSFTSDVSWINHEWLAETIFAAAYHALGPAGLILLKLLIIAVMACAIRAAIRRDIGGPLACDIAVGLALVSTISRTYAVRPQLFSLLLFSLLLWLLRSSDRGLARLAAIPLLFAAWANMHGGWMVGLLVLTLWCASKLKDRPAIYLALPALSAAATLLTPYHVHLWTFLAGTVGLSRPEIADWRPLLSMPLPVIALECVVPLIGLGAVLKARTIAASSAAILLTLAFLTVRVSRVDAFLHMATIVLLAPQLGEWFASRLTSGSTRVRVAAAVPIAILLIAATAMSQLRIVVQGSWMPDAAGVNFLKATYSGKKVLTWFDWGEYAIWHLADAGIQVSMDGRRETVYSARVVDDHFAFYRADPRKISYPAAIGADVVWLPEQLPVVPRLIESGWQVAFRSGRSIVLSRTRGASITREPVATWGLFPGP